MNNLQKTLLKYLGYIFLIILLSAVSVRILTKSETLRDYADANPEIAYSHNEKNEDDIETQNNELNSEYNIEKNDMGEAMQVVTQEAEVNDEKGQNENPQAQNVQNDNNQVERGQIDGAQIDDKLYEVDKDKKGIEQEVIEQMKEVWNPIIYKDGFFYAELSDNTKERITGISYKDNDNITYDDLRYVGVKYKNFEEKECFGEIICNKVIAQDLVEIFYELYKNEYQLERVELVDVYDGDDELSMEANNSSCFNYRVIAGTKSLSKHALGLAIDINPFYNPYIVYEKGGTGIASITPIGSEVYADRAKDFPYKIDTDDLAYQLFIEHGFTWGGNWNSSKDYQHFQKSVE